MCTVKTEPSSTGLLHFLAALSWAVLGPSLGDSWFESLPACTLVFPGTRSTRLELPVFSRLNLQEEAISRPDGFYLNLKPQTFAEHSTVFPRKLARTEVLLSNLLSSTDQAPLPKQGKSSLGNP